MTRIFASLIVALLFFPGTAFAGSLVDELRSGNSDIKAANTNHNYYGIIRYYQKSKIWPDFKVVVDGVTRIYGWQGASSAENAVEEGINYCKGQKSGACRIYSLGETVVQGYSQNKLADAIEAYQLKVVDKNIKQDLANNLYCKTSYGFAYKPYLRCESTDTQISKSEFIRLKNKNKEEMNYFLTSSK